MKKLLFAIVILNLTISCSNNSNSNNDKFLTNELSGLKSKFLAMYQNDPVRYTRDYNQLNYLGKKLDTLKVTIDNAGDIKAQLTEFKKTITDFGKFSSSLPDALNEVNYLIDNFHSLDKSVLKQHLQFIEFSYWVAYMNYESKYQFVFDKTQIYQTNNKANAHEKFSTLLIPVASNTTNPYKIIVGDSIDKNNKLLGEVEPLCIYTDPVYGEYISPYSTSTIKRGLNKKPAQFCTSYKNGKQDTINFTIEFYAK